MGLITVGGCQRGPERWQRKPAQPDLLRVEALNNRLEREGLQPLPAAQVPLLLKRGENAYYLTHADLYEEKVIHTERRGAGVGTSIRLVKGVSLRPFLYRSHPVVKKDIVQVDTGQLIVTNRRVVFIGQNKDATVDYKKLLGVTPYADALQFEHEGRKKPMIFKMDEPYSCLVYVTHAAPQAVSLSQ